MFDRDFSRVENDLVCLLDDATSAECYQNLDEKNVTNDDVEDDKRIVRAWLHINKESDRERRNHLVQIHHGKDENVPVLAKR